MKKILLLISAFGVAFSLGAQSCDQTLPISVDFSDPNIIPFCWNTVDNDGDSRNWIITDVGGGNKALQSASWTAATGPLTPDNWVITNAIDLTSYGPSSNITLTWRVITPDWSFDKENYSIYAATGNQISNFTSSPVFFTENLDNSNASGVWANRSFNISAMAGQMIYIAFRHYNSTDQNVINIDDVVLSGSGGSLAVEDFNKENFKLFYNSERQTLSIRSNNNPISSVRIYNILGQGVMDKRSTQYNEDINLSKLVDGIYIAQVEIDNTTKAIKFLKQ